MKYLDKDDEKLEQLIQNQNQAQQKKNRWDNLDYTRYVIPEGVKVENAKVTRIPPKEGEKWAKFVISAEINGHHYEQEMWGNDIKAFYEKDGNGNKTHRVKIDQLVAKYFGKDFNGSEASKDINNDGQANLLSRLWTWLTAHINFQQEEQLEDKPAEDGQNHETYTDLSDVDERIEAVRVMKDLTKVMDDYEGKININKGIIINARKMYGEKSEYISKVSNIAEAADHRPLMEINSFVDKALVNVAKNLYDMPLVRKYIEQLPVPELPKQEPKEQPQEPVQEQPEELQTVLGKMQKESVVTKIITIIMVVVAVLAVWQCSSARQQWRQDGIVEGREEMAEVANARIDSLNAVILRQRQEIKANVNHKTSYKSRRDGKSEANAFFQGLDEMKALRTENTKLKSLNSKMNEELRQMDADYETLRQKVNNYVKIYQETAGKEAAKAKKVVEIPKRRKGQIFNTIVTKEEPAPYSPDSYK